MEDKRTHRSPIRLAKAMAFRTMVRLRHAFTHIRFFIKWVFLALITGIVCGLTGTAFHHSLDIASETFSDYPQLLFALPLSGMLIVFMYRLLKIYNDQGTNSILRAARAEDTSAFRVTPLIFSATILTHICGGSAGREGAALQMGGSIGSFIGRKFKLGKYDHQLMVMCGMSATFCALFATPLAAAFLSIEIAGVGTVFYAGLVPSVLASYIAILVSRSLGVTPLTFTLAPHQTADAMLLLRIMALAALTALMGIIFCSVMHNTGGLLKRFIPNFEHEEKGKNLDQKM